MKHLKLNDNHGVSITEMLMTTIIVSILTLAIATGVGTVTKVYRASKENAEARTMANYVIQTIEDELRYAKNIEIENEKISYTSRIYGANTWLEVNNEGQLRYIIDKSSDKGFQPLSEAMDGYTIKGYTINKNSNIMEVKFYISRSMSDAKLAEVDCKFKILNH